MLDPDIVIDAVVATFLAIPEVVAEMGGITLATANIIGHKYAYGLENSLLQSIGQMASPSVLIAYQDLLGGNFDGMTMWKHRLEVYIRPRNKATTAGAGGASSPHLWWLMMNKTVTGQPTNIRGIELVSGNLQLMDTPTLMHKTDELGADIFVGNMVFPEKGDV